MITLLLSILIVGFFMAAGGLFTAFSDNRTKSKWAMAVMILGLLFIFIAQVTTVFLYGPP